MKIVFFGTPQFSAEILKDLIEKKIQIEAVVTQPDKVQGRHLKIHEPAVKKVAKDLLASTPLFQPERISDPGFIQKISSLNADFFVVVAFGQIFPKTLLDTPRLGCINVHTSLLPKYRGAAPIQRVIMDGDQETGATIMYMAEKCDAGDILAVKKMSIPPSMTSGELSIELCQLSKDLLSETLCQLYKGEITPQVQDASKVTFAKKVKPDDGKISWLDSAQKHYNQYRGVTPKPGAWCPVWIRGKEVRLKLLALHPVNAEGEASKILSYHPQNGLVVACSQGALSLDKIQIEGKKPSMASDFIRGYPQSEVSFSAPVSSKL